MVIKKTNKISQKDINLLLKKLIIIIRKISNSCGNKNKKITKGGGGIINYLKGKEEKDLLRELNSFNDVELKNTIQYFSGIANNSFENLKLSNFITPDNINPYKKGNLNSGENIQYNKTNNQKFEDYIKKENTTIYSNIISNDKQIYHIPISNDGNGFLLFYLDDTNEIKYIYCTLKYSQTIINIVYNYYNLNKDIYKLLKDSGEYVMTNKDKNIILKYKDIVNIKDKDKDAIISYLEYIDYIEKLLFNNEKKSSEKNQFNIVYLKKMQEKGGKIDYEILKHATIYNIGFLLKSLKDILVEQ
jgi:hypothetical protein